MEGGCASTGTCKTEKESREKYPIGGGLLPGGDTQFGDRDHTHTPHPHL